MKRNNETVPDCAWCGAECDQPRPYANWRGELFCSPSHRSASNRALARLTGERAPKRKNPASRLEMLHHHLKDVEEAAQRHKPAVARYLYAEAAAYLPKPRRNGAERVTVPGMGTGVVVAHRPGGMCDIRLSGGQVVRKPKSTLKPA